MKKFGVIAFVMFIAIACFAGKSGSSDLLKDIVDSKFRLNQTPIQSMKNGESYTQLSADGKKIIQYSYKTGKEEAVVFDAEKTMGKKVARIEGYSYSPTEKEMLLYTNSEKIYRSSFVADYYVFDPVRNKLVALSDSVGKQRDPKFSPNGRMVVFGKGNDLRLKKLNYGTETIVTETGLGGTVFNGVTDWLYEEEFGVTSLIEWSPDSKYFVYISLDDTQTGDFMFNLFGKYPFESNDDLYPSVRSFKYPKAGTSNPIPSLYLFDVLYKKTSKIPLSESGDIYIPRMKWINETEDLAVFIMSRNQDWMKMYAVNYKSQISNLLLEEKTTTYIDYQNLDYVTFLKDNKFTIASEKDGYRHIYLYNSTGILNKQLTSGNFDVTAFYGCDTVKNIVYYQAAETSAKGRDVFSVDIKKGEKTLLTSGVGVNSANFSSTFSYFEKQSSSAKSPTAYSICSSLGKELREITVANNLLERLAGLPQKEFLTIKNDEGIDLNAWMLKPVGFDATKKYPLVMYQYSGPNTQEVMDEYSLGFEQELAANGFVVVCVDGRGTGARGEKFRKDTYKRLGVLEAKDQLAAANYLGNLPFVNKDKMGIWGWSYGGFVTLMAMSADQQVFAAGVAVAPITDLKFYDTAWTERYMRRPQENAAYDRSSPMAVASKLKGDLLLIGGTADDNVHIQNIYEYAEQLVQADKQFDMQIYTNRNHGLKGGNTRYHMYSRITKFFMDKLK